MAAKRKRTKDLKDEDILVNRVTTARRKRAKRRRNPRNWSELPNDLLLTINSKLSCADQICFHGVCRSWRKLPYIDDRGLGLPWVVSNTSHTDDKDEIKFFNISFELFHPLLKRPYCIDELSSQIKYRDYTKILASKNGWVFLSLSRRTRGIIAFLLYSPFNKKVIKLPELDCRSIFLKTDPEDFRGTFSSDPRSSECEFCVVHPSNDNTRKVISIYRPAAGDTTWTTRLLSQPRSCVSDVLYIKGSFYCLTCNGTLVKYNPIDHKETILIETPYGHWMYYPHLVYYYNCFFMVIFESKYNMGINFTVYMLEWSTRRWFRVYRFPTLALFFGCTSFFLPANGARRDFGDKIFYHDRWDGGVRFYSLRDGRNYKVREDSLYRGWGCGKQYDPTWLQPPLLPHEQEYRNYQLIREFGRLQIASFRPNK